MCAVSYVGLMKLSLQYFGVGPFVPRGLAGAAHSSSQRMRFSSVCRGASTGRGCSSLCVQMRPSGDYVVLQSSAPLRYAATPSSDVVLKPNTMTICFNPAGPVCIRARVCFVPGRQSTSIFGSGFFSSCVFLAKGLSTQIYLEYLYQ